MTSDKDEATIKRSGSRNKRKRTTFNQGDGASKRNGNSFLSDKAFNILRSRIFVPRASSVRAVLAPWKVLGDLIAPGVESSVRAYGWESISFRNTMRLLSRAQNRALALGIRHGHIGNTKIQLVIHGPRSAPYGAEENMGTSRIHEKGAGAGYRN